MKFSKYALTILAISTPMILAEETAPATAQTTDRDTSITAEGSGAARTGMSDADTPTTAEKHSDQEKKTGTIAQVIDDSAEHSLLAKAIKAAGLEETLGEKTVRTIFAPTDAAFEKLPDGTLGKLLMPENKDKLRALLMHHVVDGDVLTMSLRDATEVKSAGGEKLDIQIGDDTREVNDARVVDTILTDTNGVILAIDQVLVPDSLDDFADWGD